MLSAPPAAVLIKSLNDYSTPRCVMLTVTLECSKRETPKLQHVYLEGRMRTVKIHPSADEGAATKHSR